MIMTFLIVICIVILSSLIIEAMRPTPPIPDKLAWAPDIPVRYATLKGHRIRYIKTGRGPNLVLLHTLRTQLDIFQKVIPTLASNFTVYALDYPGHGYSDIPKVAYEPKLFVDVIADFLEHLDVQDVTLAGISIGASISLLMAAEHNPRVKRIIAINAYDYAQGGGIRRGSLVAKVIFGAGLIPVLGDTFMRFRNRFVEKMIFGGGVAEPNAMPLPLLEELYISGTRPGHYKAFLNLLRNAYKWDRAHEHYHKIKIPVLLVYGDKDWSKPNEREKTFREIPHARMEIVAGGNHFLSLDRPHEVERLIREFGHSSK